MKNPPEYKINTAPKVYHGGREKSTEFANAVENGKYYVANLCVLQINNHISAPESGHHRTLQDIVGHFCKNPLTIRAKYDKLKPNRRLYIRPAKKRRGKHERKRAPRKPNHRDRKAIA